MRSARLRELIALEWGMFQAVPNEGGRAACQMNPRAFGVMRQSQVHDWPEVLLVSYLHDLKTAQQAGRNLMTEKYAWMMASTHPDEFAQIAHLLPDVGQRALQLIEALVAINLRWKEELTRRYPLLANRGRPLYSRDDTVYATSFETYLRGELKTWSERTLELLHEHVLNQTAQGVNGGELIVREQGRLAGYASLEQAEAASRWQQGAGHGDAV